jgi:hypothetical protein
MPLLSRMTRLTHLLPFRFLSFPALKDGRMVSLFGSFKFLQQGKLSEANRMMPFFFYTSCLMHTSYTSYIILYTVCLWLGPHWFSLSIALDEHSLFCAVGLFGNPLCPLSRLLWIRASHQHGLDGMVEH